MDTKLKGRANQAVGKAKQVAGDVANKEELQARGEAQELKGKMQVTAGKTADKAQDAGRSLKDKLKGEDGQAYAWSGGGILTVVLVVLLILWLF
jgi:uncharacterized protein YjbJ (UPF0337 family)